MQTRHISDWLVPLTLAAIVAAIYLPVLPREFIYDNKGVVEKHEMLQPGTSVAALWVSNYWGLDSGGREYRPLTMTIFWIEKHVLGFTSPAPFAVVNIVLHSVVAIILWRLVLRWTRHRAGATIAAVLFAAHPIATETVPNLVGLSDLLATGFALAALLVWERRDAQSHWVWTVAATALWLLGMLCKESVVVVPAVMMLRDVQRFGRRIPWGSWAALVVVGLTWLALRTAVLSQTAPQPVHDLINPTWTADAPVRWMTAIGVWARYVRLMLWPQWMAAEYAFNQIPLVRTPINTWFLIGIVLLIGCVALTAWTWRRKPIVAIGLTITVLAWLLISNVPFPIGTIMADRLMYLPLAGVCIAVGAAVAAWRRSLWPIVVLTLICTVALGIRSNRRAIVWQDQDNLWTQSVRDAPNNARMLLNYLMVLVPDHPEEAEVVLNRAMKILEPIEPGQKISVALNLGALYLQRAQSLGDTNPDRRDAYIAEADRWLNIAKEWESYKGGRYKSWLNKREWQAAHGKPVSQRYGEWELHMNLGYLAKIRGDPDEAVREFRIAAEIDPDHVLIYDKLAETLREMDRTREANEAMQRAAECEPTHARWLALAKTWSSDGDLDAALDAMDRAMKIKAESDDTARLMKLYNDALNAAAEAKDADRMRAIAKLAADRHRIRIDLPDDLEARLNQAPPPPAPPSPAQSPPAP